jgi:hypothetical protein
LFLPFVGWRWAVGTLPIVALYGASANEQVRAFSIYYSIVLVPFFVIAASAGALTLARRLVTNAGHAQLAAAAAVLLGPLLVGSGHRGYSLRPWKTEIAAVPQALADLAGEPRVLVLSGLFPHAGYDERFQLLTPQTLDDPRNGGAVILIAPRIGAYPFAGPEVGWLSRLPTAQAVPGGLVAVRLTPEAAKRPRHFGPGRDRHRIGNCRPEPPRPEWRSGRSWRSRPHCTHDEARMIPDRQAPSSAPSPVDQGASSFQNDRPEGSGSPAAPAENVTVGTSPNAPGRSP